MATMRSLLLASVLSAFSLVNALKVQLSPANLDPLLAEGYELWSVPQEEETASAEFDGVTLELSADGDSLNGGRNKIVATQVINPLGQWLAGAGISSTSTDGSIPIQLSVTGLSEGSHTLLVYHNAWDSLDAASDLDVSVDGETVVVSWLFQLRA
jgi:hypothetical protein